MTTQTEALKLALEALELVVLRQKEAAGKQIDAPEITRLWSALTDCIPTITAIKEALAQPEQEPVAVVAEVHISRYTIEWTNGSLPEGTKLYTTPPQCTWVGLTNDEVNNFAAGCHLGKSVQDAIYKAEAKLKEKNT